MGHVYAEVVIGDPRKTKTLRRRMLIDTGATHTVIPSEAAKELGMQSWLKAT